LIVSERNSSATCRRLASGKRAVADHRDNITLGLVEISSHRHAEAGRDRGRGMRRAERVIFALGTPGEAGEPAFLPKRPDTVATTGENLVRITLMANIEDQPVIGRIEHLVNGDGQFDDAQAGAEMAAGARHRIDHFGPELGGQLRQVLVIEFPEILRIVDLIEKRRLRH